MNNNIYYYKYKKYKLKYKNLVKQTGGSLDDLRECLREASKIFQIVDIYGKQDGINFFISGSTAVLYYVIDFYNKYSHTFKEQLVKQYIDICQNLMPNDLDFFWAEHPILPSSNYELFNTQVNKILKNSMKEQSHSVTPDISSMPKISSTRPSCLTISKPLDERDSNDENLSCIGNEKLFVIGSHYSKIPIPDDSTFFKCDDKISKFKKIDFSVLKSNVNITTIQYEGKDIRILGINDLLQEYKSRRRGEIDKYKIQILDFINKKIIKNNKYIGIPSFKIVDFESDSKSDSKFDM